DRDDAVIAVLPADHAIDDGPRFRADLRLALDVAERTDALVTLGLRPTRPETGYGYIRPGGAVRGTSGRVAWVEAFIEKPAPRRGRPVRRRAAGAARRARRGARAPAAPPGSGCAARRRPVGPRPRFSPRAAGSAPAVSPRGARRASSARCATSCGLWSPRSSE